MYSTLKKRNKKVLSWKSAFTSFSSESIVINIHLDWRRMQ